MNPLLAVVIPVYNRPAELLRALDALVTQTRKDFEVLVCDDGSKEDVASVARSYQGKLDLTYLRIENSGGPARPRNTAVAASRAPWISLLDSDDWWAENRVEVVASYLGGSIDMLYHRLTVASSLAPRARREKRNTVGDPLGPDPLRQMILFGNPVPNSSVVVRRAVLDSIGGLCEDAELHSVEDFDAWLRLVEAGARVEFVDRALGWYWVAPDNISAVHPRQLQHYEALYARHRPRLSPDLLALADACHHYRMGSLLMRMAGRRGEALSRFAKARPMPTLRMQASRLAKSALCVLRGDRRH